jgi:AraC-like DNA-binding protein
LDGNIRIKEEIASRLKLAGKYFSYDNYGIILTEINNKTFSNLPLDQREYITYKTIEIIDKQLFKICNYISINHPSNCIVTVINFENHGAVLFGLRRLLKLLENELGLPYNIAASRSVSNLLLSNIYGVTSSYLKYSYIYRYGNIFIYDSIEGYESNDEKFDFDDLKNIESLLKSCQIQLLKKTITEVIESLKKNRCSYNCVQNVFLQIIRITARVSRKQGIADQKLERNNLMSEYKNISSIDETVDWLFNLIDIYYNSIIVRNTHIDYEFISKIVEYISSNIDKQISLDIVAEEFNISSSHLSRIFNRCSGTSFSEFVKNKKLEKAAELIMKEKNVNISDIEVKLGYLTPAYFSKLFKEKYGMTPAQFRKQGIIDNSFHSPV